MVSLYLFFSWKFSNSLKPISCKNIYATKANLLNQPFKDSVFTIQMKHRDRLLKTQSNIVLSLCNSYHRANKALEDIMKIVADEKSRIYRLFFAEFGGN